MPGICRAHGRIAEAILAVYVGGDGQALLCASTHGRAVLNVNLYGLIISEYLFSKAVSNAPIQIYGGGNQLRDYIYIDDVVDAMLLSAVSDETNGKVVNLGSGMGISLSDMAELVIQLSGTSKKEYVPWPVEYAEVETGSFVANIDMIRNILHWSPKMDLKTGLAISLEHYRRG